MAKAQSIETDIRYAAYEVAVECPHALPPVSELMCKLSDADQYRDQLLKMAHASNRYMQNMITPAHHQLLIEFTSMQAAKAGIEHEVLLDEICLRYALMDAQELKIRDFWEALNFSWQYAEEKF